MDEGEIPEGLDNVVRLRPAPDEKEFAVIHGSSACNHRGTKEVNARTRTVTCRSCGANLDHFDAILLVANECERIMGSYERAKNNERALRVNIKGLERLEKNVRARLKRVDVEIPPRWSNDPEPFVVKRLGDEMFVQCAERMSLRDACSLANHLRTATNG
jgi:hypothetical protein